MRTNRRNTNLSKELKSKYEDALLASANEFNNNLSEENKKDLDDKNKTYEEIIKYVLTLNHKERRKFFKTNKLLPKFLIPKVSKEINATTSGKNIPVFEMELEDKKKIWKRRK